MSTINTESNKTDSANHYVELGNNQNHQQKHMFDIRSPLHERSEDAISSQECTAYNLDEKESISDINGEELSSAPSPKKKVEIKKMNETKLLQDHMVLSINQSLEILNVKNVKKNLESYFKELLILNIRKKFYRFMLEFGLLK